MRPAIFLDRDGTLVEEVNYLSRLEDLKIFDYTASALELFRSHGFLTVVVTNQSGIGRGIYSEEDMHRIHRQMSIELPGLIDAFYFCPHLPDAGCRCRKPGTGMFEAAVADLSIDLKASWMIGDKRLDVEAGRNAGARAGLVLTGYGLETVEKTGVDPVVVGRDLLEVAKEILDSG
jgi:D-glycero-D-manno-heptose 1,7-bisphosphate phosphatase